MDFISDQGYNNEIFGRAILDFLSHNGVVVGDSFGCVSKSLGLEFNDAFIRNSTVANYKLEVSMGRNITDIFNFNAMYTPLNKETFMKVGCIIKEIIRSKFKKAEVIINVNTDNSYNLVNLILKGEDYKQDIIIFIRNLGIPINWYTLEIINSNNKLFLIYMVLLLSKIKINNETLRSFYTAFIGVYRDTSKLKLKYPFPGDELTATNLRFAVYNLWKSYSDCDTKLDFINLVNDINKSFYLRI